MQFKEYQDVIKNIDWDLLQQQKKTLEKLLTKLSFHPAILNEDINDLWGLIDKNCWLRIDRRPCLM